MKMLSTFWSKNFVEPFVVKTHKRITTEHTITSGRSCNDRCFEARCPENIVLKTPWDVKALSYWLCHYVCERKEGGWVKVPSELLAGLLQHMESN